MERFDVIVLGLGAVGSASLYQLARKGARVLGIDRFAPPHSLGSSHGETRITRLAIGEGAHYSPLAIRSHEIWRELEAATGESLLTANGALIISDAAGGSSFHGNSFFATTVEAAHRHGIAHEMLDAPAMRRRYPQFAVGDGETGYFEPSAGFVRPEACIGAQLREAEAHGAEIRRNEKVHLMEQSGRTVTVGTQHGSYSADQLVIAAGPWLSEFLDPDLSRHFKVHRQVLYWFDVEGDFESFAPERFPVFIWELPAGKGVTYGFPAVGGPKDGFKIATEHYEFTTTPGMVERRVSTAEVETMFDRFVAPYFPQARRNCVRTATCLYTVTRDFGFVVDRHPQQDRVLVASPCSGHGFKHSAALGEAIAALTTGGASPFDLGAFGFARLGA